MEATPVLFEPDEKFDTQFSMRAPKELLARIAKAAARSKSSVNKTRVRLLGLGLDVFDWMQGQNAEALEVVRRENGLLPHEVIPHLLAAGLQAERKKK